MKKKKKTRLRKARAVRPRVFFALQKVGHERPAAPARRHGHRHRQADRSRGYRPRRAEQAQRGDPPILLPPRSHGCGRGGRHHSGRPQDDRFHSPGYGGEVVVPLGGAVGDDRELSRAAETQPGPPGQQVATCSNKIWCGRDGRWIRRCNRENGRAGPGRDRFQRLIKYMT